MSNRLAPATALMSALREVGTWIDQCNRQELLTLSGRAERHRRLVRGEPAPDVRRISEISPNVVLFDLYALIDDPYPMTLILGVLA